MAEDPCLPVMEKMTETGDELKEVIANWEVLKPLENSWLMTDVSDGVYLRPWKTYFDCTRDYFQDVSGWISPLRQKSAMAEDPCLPFMEEMTELGDELKEVIAEVEVLKRLENAWQMADVSDDVCLRPWKTYFDYLRDYFQDVRGYDLFRKIVFFQLPSIRNLTSLRLESCKSLHSILYLIGYIDRGGSKRGSSTSLDFRDIYISIVLFLAAYLWIKFRDVIPRGAVYHRCDSNKYEPRIKFPVTRGVGVKSKRIPLGLYNTFAEGEVAYQIAAFYCNKRKHTGRLYLGGGASFPIPTLSLDSNLPYEEKVKLVGDQVLRVYAEFEEQKAARNLSPCVPGLALEMRNGEGQLIASSSIHQLRQPLNSGMDLAMECQGSQLDPNIHNGVDFNNPSSLLPVLVKTQHELLDAHKEIECLKAQVSRTEIESMGWEIKYSELERENGLLNQQIMQLQSQLQTQHQEQQI